MSYTDTVSPVIALYRVPAKAIESFLPLLEQHAPLLQKLGLSTGNYQLFKMEGTESTTFIEIFAWATAESADIAHTLPEINNLWSQMESFCESYNGLRKAEFWDVEAVL